MAGRIAIKLSGMVLATALLAGCESVGSLFADDEVPLENRSAREIFDEIDRSVGGATANSVGRRLSRLAGGAQVLVVTHSPQVAAKGDAHFRILKSAADGVTRTDVTLLGDQERTDEIARMLAGDTITNEARSAALALIEDR